MKPLPLQYQRYAEKARSLIQQRAIRTVEFSGGTYQIEIFDPELQESVWAFLQFDEKNRLSDAFCTCESEETNETCVHLAAAFQRIFLNSEIALHERFGNSLWNILCFSLCDKAGDDPHLLIPKGSQGYILTHEQSEIFSINASSKAAFKSLESLLKDRPHETEETSLKFSNLSEKEIHLWKQGRPSMQLRYELSFWNDLAKWMLFLEEEGKLLRLSFDYTPSQIPQHLILEFSDLTMRIKLNSQLLTSLIPCLGTLPSPLKIYGKPEDQIDYIVYDDKEEVLLVYPTDDIAEIHEAQPLDTFGEWDYFANKGFYFRGKHPLVQNRKIPKQEIGTALHNDFSLIRKKLVGTQIEEDSLLISYTLHFDKEWSLRIEAYLQQPGDLKTGPLKFFDDWCYSPSKGFFRLENPLFEGAELVIPENKVSEFIQTHRLWIGQQEGFQIHVTSVEAKLVYTLLKDHSLIFSKAPIVEETEMLSKDFGSWIYINGQGFFSKLTNSLGNAIKEGLQISPKHIPLFIRAHKEELSLIPGFFSEKNPLEKIGVRIELLDNEMVQIRPEYLFLSSYSTDKILLFEEYVYVHGEGFYAIPERILLPERFRHLFQINRQHFPAFFTKEEQKIAPYLLSIDPSLIEMKELKTVVEKIEKTEQGYRIKLQYATKTIQIKASEIWGASKNHDRFFFSKQGYIDLSEDRFSWMLKTSKKQFDLRSNWLKLSPIELLKINAFDPLSFTESSPETAQFLSLHPPEEPDLRELKSTLRSYQQLGVHWLWFLYSHGLSGLLCDDMGLGKTHQSMGLMAAILHANPIQARFLIICPTSVIFHWQEKLEKYLPKARVCVYHGGKRSLSEFTEQGHVLLTSYGIWRNETTLLSQFWFDVAFLDEIHTAKNETSRIHHSLLKIQARIRLGLTGTPIENRLRELKALFDIIVPHYMPSENEYRQFFILPIERENNSERKVLLNRFIKPFVLRRKKGDVLLDLPQKIEELAHCALSKDQAILYNQLLQTTGKQVCEELRSQMTPMPYIHIFSVLSSLKQICNHPAVYLKTPLTYKNYNSGKWDLFLELLSEALESEQKVVIFSQYLAMLDIFEQYLEENQIDYATIRGATTDRGEQVRRFNQDPSCKVFLGSLHAAGFGIDLTAGSVVIHYDRWWNAAREDQATDRVHRIGQTRGVQVFKLVTKGTFEERIDEMIFRKRRLMEDVVSVDDYRFIKQFDRQELLELFQMPEM